MAEGKLQRDPTTGKIKRNMDGKLVRNSSGSSTCCCEEASLRKAITCCDDADEGVNVTGFEGEVVLIDGTCYYLTDPTAGDETEPDERFGSDCALCVYTVAQRCSNDSQADNITVPGCPPVSDVFFRQDGVCYYIGPTNGTTSTPGNDYDPDGVVISDCEDGDCCVEPTTSDTLLVTIAGNSACGACLNATNSSASNGSANGSYSCTWNGSAWVHTTANGSGPLGLIMYGTTDCTGAGSACTPGISVSVSVAGTVTASSIGPCGILSANFGAFSGTADCFENGMAIPDNPSAVCHVSARHWTGGTATVTW
jgi:hypothetical protein